MFIYVSIPVLKIIAKNIINSMTMKIYEIIRLTNLQGKLRGLLNRGLSLLLVVILIQVGYAQDCDFYADENIEFTATGGNQNSDYQTIYVLTNSSGIIVETSTSNSFTNQDAGDYDIYALNYRTSDGITGLVQGLDIIDVTGDCFDLSNRFLVTVCEVIDCSDFFITAAEDVFKCPNIPVVISVGASHANTNLVWSNGQEGGSITVNPSVTTTYSITGTNLTTGCVDTDEITVNVLPEPSITLTDDTAICSGSSIDLNATVNNGAFVIWSTNQTGNTITVSPTVTTTYEATVIEGSCSNMESVTVTVNPKPTVSITSSEGSSICAGENTILSATTASGNSILWSNGATTQSISVNPSITTTYTAVVTDVNNCTENATFELSVLDNPIVSITSSEGATVCAGTSTVLTATTTAGNSLLWNTGETTSSINVSPSETTTYSVEVSNNDGCVEQEEFTVNVSGPCNICEEFTCPTECSYCESEEVSFTTQGGNSFLTTVYAITDENGVILELTSSTNLGLRPIGLGFVFPINYDEGLSVQNLAVGSNIYDVTGDCLDIGDPYIFKVCEDPSVAITSSESGVLCLGNVKSLTAVTEAGNSILWSTGATTASIDVSPSETTTYSVEVTNSFGCTEQENLTITITGSCNLCETYTCPDVCSYCEDDEISFTATGGNSFLTTVYAITNELGEILELTSSTDLGTRPEGLLFIFPVNYDDTKPFSNIEVGQNIASVNGECLDVGEPLIIRICEALDFEIDLSKDGVLCTNDEVQITAVTSSENNFLWSNGDTTQTILVSPTETTTYSVTVSNGAGCEVTKEVTIEVSPCNRLGNFVWLDVNSDGIQDPGELGVEDVTVNLVNSVTGETIMTTETDENGNYIFEGIPVGSYYLEFVPPSGYISTTPNFMNNDEIDSDIDDSHGTNTTDIYIVDTHTDNISVDAGLVPAASIGDFVWFEEEPNGQYEEGKDTPLEGIEVKLIDISGDRVLSTTTDENGFYLFDNLRPGFYIVEFAPQEDFDFVPSNIGNDNSDSDVTDFLTGRTNILILASGQHRRDVDAGYTDLAALPIELLSFTGYHAKSIRANTLEWSTAMEINSKGFVLQKLNESTGLYTDIYEEDSAGNSVIQRDYSYNDFDIKPGKTYYYRLIHQDLDGTRSEYGPVKIVVAGDKGSVALYPNPTPGEVTIDYVNPFNADINITVYNATGQLVRVLNNYDRVTASSLQIDMESFTNGVYTFRIDVGDDSFIERVVKL